VTSCIYDVCLSKKFIVKSRVFMLCLFSVVSYDIYLTVHRVLGAMADP